MPTARLFGLKLLIANYQLQILYVRIQLAGTHVASEAAVRDAAEKNGADRSRGFVRRRVGHRQNGWPQTGFRDQDRSRGGEERRHRNAAGPGDGRAERSLKKNWSDNAIKRRRHAKRTGRHSVIWQFCNFVI